METGKMDVSGENTGNTETQSQITLNEQPKWGGKLKFSSNGWGYSDQNSDFLSVFWLLMNHLLGPEA
jgi:hypothetical protein